MGILYSAGEGTVYANMAATFTVVSGYAFLAFNLLCAPASQQWVLLRER